MFLKLRITLTLVGVLSLLAACGAPSPSPSTPPTDLPAAALTEVGSTPQSASTSQTDSHFDCQNVEEIPVKECQALVALYHSTNGEDWADSTGWLVTETPCTWVGVMCYPGHVTELRLYSNQLSGSIPAALGDLQNLHLLDLSHNQLSGSIPAELENVAILYWLDLSYNQLTGPVSPGLTKALREDLRLWGNLLDGTVPVSKQPVIAVEFQGVGFDFSSSMAESVWPEIRAAFPPTEGGPGWEFSPEHIRFTFADRRKPDTFRLRWVGGTTDLDLSNRGIQYDE